MGMLIFKSAGGLAAIQKGSLSDNSIYIKSETFDDNIYLILAELLMLDEI
jgi:hypothetical protein